MYVPWKVIVLNIVVLLMISSNGNAKKVLLKDVDVLTLYQEKFTTGRRSSPMPQLECVSGGSAPCTSFKPRVVQCTNRGSDGYDIQWECKSDMDNAVRFGHVEVSCEGYDYPDDPYILHGSCGLKYSIDYTKEGLNKGHHDYYGNENSYYSDSKHKAHSGNWIADILVYIAIGLVVYAFYVTCINPAHTESDSAYSRMSDDHPPPEGRGGGYGWFGGRTNPTAPPNSGYQDDASCRNRNTGGGSSTGGFWTGAATGGLLGYMFGQRQNWGGGNNTYRQAPRYGGGGWFSSPGYSSGGYQSHSSSSSSGTRTASGFGGTSRR